MLVIILFIIRVSTIMAIPDNLVPLFNTFQQYYQQLYKKDKEPMITNLDESKGDVTNRSMELFYEFLEQYKNNNTLNPKLNYIYTVSEYSKRTFDSAYGLVINDDIQYMSPSILSLLQLVVNKQYSKWDIMKIK